MTFKEIIDMVLYKVDEDVEDTDIEILELVKNAINEGYMYIASRVDCKIKNTTIPYSKAINLPGDFFQLVDITHSSIGDLSQNDYIVKANLLYIKSKDVQNGDISLSYIYFPKKLIEETDLVDIKDSYCYALSIYGAYVYQACKKKLEVAQLLLSEFNNFIRIGGDGANEA